MSDPTAVRTTETVPWPASLPPVEKPWWFDDAHPWLQERYLKQLARAGSGPKEGELERVELRAELPGEKGFECTFYQGIALRTVHLRRSVYVTVLAAAAELGDLEEFRPALDTEHFPSWELSAYQMAELAAIGKGRRLEVTFVCYSPGGAGSGAAKEAALAIRAALEELREVATTWPGAKRSRFAARLGARALAAVIRDRCSPPYRPPQGALPYRRGAPMPKAAGAKLTEKPDEVVSRASLGGKPTTLEDQVRDRLERWGVGTTDEEVKRAIRASGFGSMLGGR